MLSKRSSTLRILRQQSPRRIVKTWGRTPIVLTAQTGLSRRGVSGGVDGDDSREPTERREQKGWRGRRREHGQESPVSGAMWISPGTGEKVGGRRREFRTRICVVLSFSFFVNAEIPPAGNCSDLGMDCSVRGLLAYRAIESWS